MGWRHSSSPPGSLHRMLGLPHSMAAGFQEWKQVLQTSRDIGLEFSECHFCILLINASHRPDQFNGWVYKHCILMRKWTFAHWHRRHSWQPALKTICCSFQEVNWYAKHYSWENAKTPPSSMEKNLKVSNPKMDSFHGFLLLRGGGVISIRVKVKVRRAGWML